MKSRKCGLLIFCAGLLLAGKCWACSHEQITPTCSSSYENHNQTDNGPLKVGAVAGIAKDGSGVAVSGACLLLFTEVNHSLMQTGVSAADGTFSFQEVPPGRYRLVIKYNGFCAANIPLKVINKAGQKAKIAVHLRPSGSDTCSDGELTS